MFLLPSSRRHLSDMGGLSVLLKDLREHGLALFGLATGLIVVVLLSLARQRASEFSLSSFEVVRFALISVIPLIGFIVGNRLIVREYTGGTRLFVESLPLNVATPLIVKYLIGWCYLLLLGAVLVGVAGSLANAAEFVQARYVLLLLLKTSAVVTLYWSVVFFASLTGKLRLLIYLAISLTLITLINLPGFDANGLAPIALMDRQLFVLEGSIIPWRMLLETFAVSVLFTLCGFALALINEGSVIEQLGKPLSKRNLAAMALLGLGVFSVYTTLQEKWAGSAYDFTGEHVLRNDIPLIEISYLDVSYGQQAEKINTDLAKILSRFQADSGLATLPRLQVSLNEGLEQVEIYPEFNEGVLVAANFAEYNDYQYSLMHTVGLHHLLLVLTNSRWDLETRHWLLDGLARWWVEGAANATDSPNNPEHFARAILAQRRIALNTNPLLLWQTITDQYGFEAAGAMAYTALLYLAETQGSEVVIKLAKRYINENPGSSSLESLKHLFDSDFDRFEEVTGLNFNRFVGDWRRWLQKYQDDPAIKALLMAVPEIEGDVRGVVDSRGVFWLEASYKALPGYTVNNSGSCVLRHQPAPAYDVETEASVRERDRQPCVIGEKVHRVESRYSAGDRAYVVLEFESDQFSRPIPLWAGRVHLR